MSALKNPFAVYVAAFGSVLLLYQLGWSEIYPGLSRQMLAFLGVTFLAAIILAWLVSPAVKENEYSPGLMGWWALAFVVVTFAIELWLTGGVPLLMVMRGVNFFQEIEKNATHLHVFTFWSVFSTIRFADFIYSRRVRYLLEASLPVLFYVLMIYRGPAIMTLASWGFLLIIRHNGLKLRYLAFGAGALVLVLVGNGVLGDVRSPGQEVVGAPSKAFYESGVPRGFFWGYLYLTVPMANLQKAVNDMPAENGTALEFVTSELLPDTFSRRILPLLNDGITSHEGNLISRDQLYGWDMPLVAPGLNTATIFGRAYGYLGWLGAALMFVALASFCTLYLILIRHSPYRVPALALLNTLVLFCLLNNMIASAAMIPQLVWPLLLPPWRRSHTA